LGCVLINLVVLYNPFLLQIVDEISSSTERSDKETCCGNQYEINPGFETGPNGHRTLVCTPKLDKYLKMP
jgi:hypothetical protein